MDKCVLLQQHMVVRMRDTSSTFAGETGLELEQGVVCQACTLPVVQSELMALNRPCQWILQTG